MKIKSKLMYSLVCVMLSVMTFTSLTAFADTGDIINAKYLGMYNNPNNSNSFFTIRSGADYPITALAVYSYTSHMYFNGSGEDVVINSWEFGANFNKVRKTDENGVILEDRWFPNVMIAGTTSSSWFGSVITVTMSNDGTQYIKR